MPDLLVNLHSRKFAALAARPAVLARNAEARRLAAAATLLEIEIMGATA